MPQVGHRTVMEMLFMGMAIGPNALLSYSVIGIKKIWMPLKLDVTRFAQPLLMGVMIGPSQKLNGCLLGTLQHIAAVAHRKRTKNDCHGESLVSM